MARQRNMGTGQARNRVSGPETVRGYKLGQNQSAKDVLAVEAALLESEGIDPSWPGFDESSQRTKSRRASK